MAKTKTGKRRSKELDSVYFLKLVAYLLIGSLWFKITKQNSLQVPLPVGLAVGLMLTRYEAFQIDKKIELAVLVVAALIGFWAPIGLYIRI